MLMLQEHLYNGTITAIYSTFILPTSQISKSKRKWWAGITEDCFKYVL